VLLDKLESGLLAYETHQGLFHAQASGWQRFHLLWTFRNFNSLPLKLLNAREQKLVDSLYRTSLIRLPHHPGRDVVIGRVEQYKPTPEIEAALPKKDASDTIELAPERKSEASRKQCPEPGETAFTKIRPGKRYFAVVGGAVCALIAIFGWDHIQARPAAAAAIAPQLELVRQLSAGEDPRKLKIELGVAQTATVDVQPPPSEQAAVAIPQNQAAVSDELSRQSHPPTNRLAQYTKAALATVANAPDKHEADKTPPVLASANTAQQPALRIEASRSPADVVYPVFPGSNIRGKVALKAILKSDGTVSDIRVLSGNQILADAATRAVRRWHYAPYYLDGMAVETETNVTISFIAPDAIVISFPSTVSYSR
jgi:periplasmic protein TonB